MKRATGGRGGRGGGEGEGEGEIVQVEGGHIIRSTSKKDRHSKVYTAKGPRDRRVRLAAQTAIQFYDVQDRLGYDRPSKAVDWLFKKAKNAIDKLAELPPWNPSMGNQEQSDAAVGYVFELQNHIQEPNNTTSSYIAQEHEDEQCIDDTMKAFLPTSSGMNLQNYPREDHLGLSLHTSSNQVELSGFQPHYGKSTMDLILSSSSNEAMTEHPLFYQNQEFSQRGPLQSNNYSHFVHSWGHQNAHHSSMSSTHFGSSQFQVPARIQAEDQSAGVFPLRASSDSPVSHF